MKSKDVKICFASSSGGHLEQLLMLKPLMIKYKSFIVTEKSSYNLDIDIPVYELLQVNRQERNFIFRMLINTIRSTKIFIKETPDVVVCTGVLACIPICLLAKAFRKKLVYIESFAKIYDGTLTGRLLYRFADRFYVQWKSMLDVYPNAVYVGGIY